MNRKLITGLLSALCAVVCALGFSACDGASGSSSNHSGGDSASVFLPNSSDGGSANESSSAEEIEEGIVLEWQDEPYDFDPQLFVGDIYTLVATLPQNLSEHTVTWESSDESVVTVAPYEEITQVLSVTPRKQGRATITARAGDLSAACKITVVDNTGFIFHHRVNEYENKYNGIYSHMTAILYSFIGYREDGEVIIPSIDDYGYPVTEIYFGAFEGRSDLTSVTIPDTMTSIGAGAFNACSSLTSITIPESVTNIGDHAFSMCPNLSRVTIKGDMTVIGDYAFGECTNLASVSIKGNATIIGANAFYSCLALTNITINGARYITAEAFEKCEVLKDVYFGGTKAQWEQLLNYLLYINLPNDCTVHCSDGDIRID